MTFRPDDRNLEYVRKLLPSPAFAVWCEAASASEVEGLVYNACVQSGWEAVSKAGWSKPPVGKRWVLQKDNPTPSDVHVDVPLGSNGKDKGKKKRRPVDSVDEWTGADNEADVGDQTRAVAKAGARHSASDVKSIQSVHDHSVSLGATCSGAMGKAGARHSKVDQESVQALHDHAIALGATCEPVEKVTEPDADIPLGDSFELSSGRIAKIDDNLGLVFGWAIICKKDGQDYFDLQDDHIPEDAMLKASADFMLNSRVSGDMHLRDENGNPVQDGATVFTWPMTSDVAKAMGVQSPTTGLMIAIKPSHDVLAKFKDGTYTGFSIGGSRLRDEVLA